MHVYPTTWKPDHHRAWADGRVYTHILVAEQKLGRELKEGEVVHHIDKNKQNNSPDNLMVFRSDGDHRAYHAGSTASQSDDGSWYCDRKYICKNCGTEFYLKPGRKIRKNLFCCKACYYAYRSIIRVPINTIISDLYNANGNFSEVGRKYGVSPNAIIKYCKSNGKNYHSKDFKSK